MKRRARRNRQTEAEINITAFMNLMVVLVPFLLITAVFSQISILQLNLPATSPTQQPQQEQEDKKPIVLEVLVYQSRLEVVDRQTGPLKIIPDVEGQHDYDSLVETLKKVKLRFPDITEVTILLEADTPYEDLVTTMDKVRVTQQADAEGELEQAELFPDISIGDAPADTAAASGGAA